MKGRVRLKCKRRVNGGGEHGGHKRDNYRGLRIQIRGSGIEAGEIMGTKGEKEMWQKSWLYSEGLRGEKKGGDEA